MAPFHILGRFCHLRAHIPTHYSWDIQNILKIGIEISLFKNKNTEFVRYSMSVLKHPSKYRGWFFFSIYYFICNGAFLVLLPVDFLYLLRWTVSQWLWWRRQQAAITLHFAKGTTTFQGWSQEKNHNHSFQSEYLQCQPSPVLGPTLLLSKNNFAVHPF